MGSKLNFYFQSGNETKAYYDIHSKLVIKMKENLKRKKTIEFGNIKKGMYIINTSK